MSKIQAEVIAHSKNEFEDELITFVVTFPRIILAELNTHRAFSRNSASSRAIPFNKMVESVQTDPFISIAWQKEHKGMQGTEYITDKKVIKACEAEWLKARDYAIQQASALTNIGLFVPDYSSVDKDEYNQDMLNSSVTKQLANRLLEPFMWHTAIITTSKEGLENFFDLRCPQYLVTNYNDYDERLDSKTYKSKKEVILDWTPGHIHSGNLPLRKRGCSVDDLSELDWLYLNKGQAEIHMMALAEAMYDSYNKSTPELLKGGEWHIPYKKQIEELWDKTNLWCWDSEDSTPNIAYVSSVMCARVSYTVTGHDLTEWTLNKYLDKAMELANAKPLHASPFEHCAQNMGDDVKWYGRFTPSKDKDQFVLIDYDNGWCRNFKGFIQLRHILETNKN